MAKTTKKVQGIHSLIKFQRHQGVESLTIEGKESLADLKQDNKGDTSLILNADKDKVNEVVSNVPYLGIAHTTTGEAPNQTKTATVSQDLTQFPLTGGELVTVDKTAEGLTLNDTKVKELIDTKAEALKKELGSGAGGGTGATASQYDLEAEEVLNAEFGVEGEKLRYSTFILSLEYNGKYDSHFIHIPINNNEITNKLSDNTIIRIQPKAEGFYITLYFKNATSVAISGVDYCNSTETPTLTINRMSETFADVSATLTPTTGNVPQPLDDDYDHL